MRRLNENSLRNFLLSTALDNLTMTVIGVWMCRQQLERQIPIKSMQATYTSIHRKSRTRISINVSIHTLDYMHKHVSIKIWSVQITSIVAWPHMLLSLHLLVFANFSLHAQDYMPKITVLNLSFHKHVSLDYCPRFCQCSAYIHCSMTGTCCCLCIC